MVKLSEAQAHSRDAVERLLEEVHDDVRRIGRDTSVVREDDDIAVRVEGVDVVEWHPDGSATVDLGTDPGRREANRIRDLGPKGVTAELSGGRWYVVDGVGQRLVADRPVRVDPSGRFVWSSRSVLDSMPPFGEGGVTRAVRALILAGWPAGEIVREVRSRYPDSGLNRRSVHAYRSRMKSVGML